MRRLPNNRLQRTALRAAAEPGRWAARRIEAVALALDVDDCRMVQKAVEDRRGEDMVTEDLAPAGQALIGRDQERAALVAA